MPILAVNAMKHEGLFGRTPKQGLKRAPVGALPNSLFWSNSRQEAALGAPSSFHWGGGATKTWLQATPTILHPNSTDVAVLSNVFQNSFSSTREAAPLKEPEPELFLKEPELCQTDPQRMLQTRAKIETDICSHSFRTSPIASWC